MKHLTQILASTAIVAMTAIAAPASATTFEIFGDTSGGTPTFNRPLANGNNAPTGLSAVGTAVTYSTFQFSVPTAASYNFVLTSLTTGYDPFLILYAGGFNPSSPLTNALVANDDLGSTTVSGFTRALTQGVSYTAVVTGFDNADVGRFHLLISDVAAVPEPASWAMMIGGFGLVGGALRRRKANVRTSVRFA